MTHPHRAPSGADGVGQRDALSAERRTLPMVRIEKDDVFEGPNGRRTLGDLFEGRSQLIVHRFMFDPEWDEGCMLCSPVAGNYVGALVHLAARDTSFAVISRAPIGKIERFKKRMGWDFPWLSSFGSAINYDFHVRLAEAVAPVEYNYRDKQEDWEEPPGRSDSPFMAWLRHHDKYDGVERSEPCCGSGKRQSGFGARANDRGVVRDLPTEGRVMAPLTPRRNS